MFPYIRDMYFVPRIRPEHFNSSVCTAGQDCTPCSLL